MNEEDNSVLPQAEQSETETPQAGEPADSSGAAAEQTNETELKLISEKLDAFMKQENEEELEDVAFRQQLLEAISLLQEEPTEETPLAANPILSNLMGTTSPQEQQEATQAVSFYADMTIIVILIGLGGILVAWKLLSTVFNLFTRHMV